MDTVASEAVGCQRDGGGTFFEDEQEWARGFGGVAIVPEEEPILVERAGIEGVGFAEVDVFEGAAGDEGAAARRRVAAGGPPGEVEGARTEQRKASGRKPLRAGRREQPALHGDASAGGKAGREGCASWVPSAWGRCPVRQARG